MDLSGWIPARQTRLDARGLLLPPGVLKFQRIFGIVFFDAFESCEWLTFVDNGSVELLILLFCSLNNSIMDVAKKKETETLSQETEALSSV